MADEEERKLARAALDDKEARERLALLQARIGAGGFAVPVTIQAGARAANGDDIRLRVEKGAEASAWAIRFGLDWTSDATTHPPDQRRSNGNGYVPGWPHGSTVVTVLLEDGRITTLLARDVRVPDWFLPPKG